MNDYNPRSLDHPESMSDQEIDAAITHLGTRLHAEESARRWRSADVTRSQRGAVCIERNRRRNDRTRDDLRHVLGAISDTLLNGGYMTNANVAFQVLCEHLDVVREDLPVDRRRVADIFARRLARFHGDPVEK